MNEIFVVKVGTDSLATKRGVNKYNIGNITSGINYLIKNNKRAILITSGAVASGKYLISKYNKNVSIKNNIRYKQLCAGIGQRFLLNEYQNYFDKYNILTTQLLIDNFDLENKEGRQTIKENIYDALNSDIVPIINYNDATSKYALMYSDNDKLAYDITELINASNLIILTNVDGLYDKFPNGNLIKFVNEYKKELFDCVNGTSTNGSGGMKSKLEIGFKMLEKNIPMYLSNVKYVKSLFKSILENKDFIGTLFKKN